MSAKRGIFSGGLAGAISSFVFVVIHDLFISDIWSTLLAMLLAGALCGICVGWTYALLFRDPSLRSWILYNLNYLCMFVVLGIVSVVIFEPVTTIAALIEANEPPNELFAEALPMTTGFVLLTTVYMSWLYARNWIDCAALAVTCVVLVVFLGLNVSVLGLVQVPKSSAFLVAELFGLIFVLVVTFAIAFVAIEHDRFVGRRPDPDA